MRAMILAAGFGTRLKKITEKIPKPLVKLERNKRIIDYVINILLKTGINEIAVNLHHKGDLIEDYLKERYRDRVNWKFFHEKEILGTGGGLLNAISFFENEENFVLINSDILTFLDLEKIIKIHNRKKSSIASMVIFENPKDRRALFYDPDKKEIIGFSEKDIEKSKLKKVKKGTFTGIHIINRKLFDYMKNKSGFFSIIEVYRDAIKNGEKVNSIETDDYWADIGTVESLRSVKKDMKIFDFIETRLGDKIKGIKIPFRGGSSKKIFRIKSDGISRVSILSSKEEIIAIDSLSRFFYKTKFPVPFIIKSSKDWLLMEDGGEVSLMEFVNRVCDKNEFPFDYYKKAIDYLEELAKIDIKRFPEKALYQRAYFDMGNIIFDLNYFNNHYFNKRLTEEEIKKFGQIIYDSLKQHPLSIMHRDYQSSNILINNNGELRIVDFQTMRIGFSVYDLASLLFDSYIPFDMKRTEELLDYFFSLETFKSYKREVFWAAALIRILQNLGAFAKLGKDNNFFKEKIKEAEKRLKVILKEVKIDVPSTLKIY